MNQFCLQIGLLLVSLKFPTLFYVHTSEYLCYRDEFDLSCLMSPQLHSWSLLAIESLILIFLVPSHIKIPLIRDLNCQDLISL